MANIPTKSVDNFVAQLRGAAYCINNALSETVDWPIPKVHLDQTTNYLRTAAKVLREIGDEFDRAAHGKE